MENEKKLKSAKTQHVIFRVFQILGIVMIPVGFALIMFSFINYVNEVIVMTDAKSVMESFMTYVWDITLKATIMYAGIAMTIVFSILASKKKKIIKELKNNN